MGNRTSKTTCDSIAKENIKTAKKEPKKESKKEPEKESKKEPEKGPKRKRNVRSYHEFKVKVKIPGKPTKMHHDFQ